MSTFRTLFVTLTSLTSLALATSGTSPQGATGPGKLRGPAVICASSSAMTSQETSRAHQDGIYIYTVELNHTSAVDTTVNVTGVTDSAQPIDYVVVVPAGSLSATFEVVAVNPGYDILVASNAYSSAAMEVTVL